MDIASASQLFREPPMDFLDVGVGEVAYRRVGSGKCLVAHADRYLPLTSNHHIPGFVDDTTLVSS